MKNVLPDAELMNITVKNRELSLVSTNDNKTYRVEGIAPNILEVFLGEIKSVKGIGVTYTQESNYYGRSLKTKVSFYLI